MDKKKIIKSFFKTGNIVYALFQGLELRAYLPKSVPYSMNIYNIAPATYHIGKDLPRGGYIIADVRGVKRFIYNLKFTDSKKVTELVEEAIEKKYKSIKNFLEDMVFEDMVKAGNISAIQSIYREIVAAGINWVD